MLGVLEDKIRLKVVFIYIIVAAICAGMIYYVYTLKTNVDVQAEKIEQYNVELELANQLIHSVNESQMEVNRYFSTKRYAHYKAFKANLDTVKLQIDSIVGMTENEQQLERLNEISRLLVSKGSIIYNLNKQFNNPNPIDSITDFLQTIEPVLKMDSVQVTMTRKDTIIRTAPKKNFWKKLSGLFSSSNGDSVVTVVTSKTETIPVVESDSLEAKKDTLLEVSKVMDIAVQAKEGYLQKMQSIERNLNNLIVADQMISSEISTLLIDFYKQTVQRRIDETLKIEALIQDSMTYTIVSGAVALLLILLFIILIISDVNKGYKARKELEKANFRIKQVMESRHSLLLSMSHDIKTPLNSILGFLELKKSDGRFDPHEMRSMKSSGEHILALLGNLLEFSSLEQGTTHLANRDFNLYELCVETVEMFLPLAQKKKLQIHSSFDFNKGLFVHADALKIKQIMVNVLSNSIKYTTEGSVSFSVSYKDGEINCTIKDTGVGIPKNRMNQLFMPFSRIDQNAHLAEGSGFGLFVVRGLIDLLKGTITMTSDVGKGTLTVIAIPAEEVELPESFVSKKILVIDDDPSYLMVVRDMLFKLGHNPVTAEDKASFEKRLADIRSYDEVLTDMEMGEFTGMEVLKRVKEVSDKPVTIITAREDVKSETLIQQGFRAYIKKPVSMGDLQVLYGGEMFSVAEGQGFNLLREMLCDDEEAIFEVLSSFVTTTADNVIKLHKAVLAGDFATAQFLSHKMLPMFIQLELTEHVDTLRKMDNSRNQPESTYKDWEKDVAELVVYTEQAVERIKEYLSDSKL